MRTAKISGTSAADKEMTNNAKKPGAKVENNKFLIRNTMAELTRSFEFANIATIPVNPARPIENSQTMPSGSNIELSYQ